MGVSFFVDPELLKDPSTRDVNTITLSYTMFRKPDAAPPPPVARAGTSGRTVN
jgi:cytochrome c oxidase assembly protein subunit 11